VATSATATKKKEVTASDVLLFYPNLIGYARVIFMIMSLWYMVEKEWKKTLLFYLLAFGGDVVDGYVARAFKQSSQYGGVLDMVTDRVSTCGFLVMLTQFEEYKKYTFAFAMLIIIDISSHWFHVMSVSAHHKSKEALEDRNVFLKWYYSIYPLFGYCCVGTEMFYVFLYVLAAVDPNPYKEIVEKICWYGCFPACIMKQFVNFVQLASAAHHIAEKDASER
jgi:CDP-diacylglycerol--inositol 3-phosphatidyltransferase